MNDFETESRIRATLLNYLRGIDRDRPTQRLGAFARRGCMYIDGVKVIGRGAVHRPGDAPPAPGLPSRESIIAMTHHLHQYEIVPVGDGFAVESDTTSHLIVREGDDRFMLIRGVRYHDRMSHYGDQILIDERQHHIDWMVRVPELFQIPLAERADWDAFVAHARQSVEEQGA